MPCSAADASPTASATLREIGRSRPTFVYDGHCVLCSAMARHVIARDPEGRIRLVAAQSPEGRALYQSAGLNADDLTTNLFVERDGRVLTHGDSSLRILEEIGYPATLTRAARLVPKPLRDELYSLVARSRFRIFGRHATCQIVARADGGPYRRMLGAEVFEQLPEVVRRVHEGGDGSVVMLGIADVTRGRGLLACLICTAFSLPPAGRAIPLAVTITRQGTGERWVRSFDGCVMTSRQDVSRRGELVERFGLMLVALDVKVDGDGLTMSPRKAWLAGLPLPAMLVPSGYGREGAGEGRYRFDVEIGWLGRRVVSYAGHLDHRAVPEG